MQKNGFLKQFTIIGGGTFFNLLLGLFSTPVITRIVAPSEYGQLSIFTMYSGIALMVLCMGLDQAVVRYYYEKENLKYKQALMYCYTDNCEFDNYNNCHGNVIISYC